MNQAIWEETLQQAVFRQLLQAMARPGQSHPLHDCDDSAWLAVLASLVDQAVSLADPHELLSQEQRNFLGASIRPSDEADFLFLQGDRWEEDLSIRRGTLERPDSGATCIFRVTAVGEGADLATLTGPGIAEQGSLRCTGLDPRWLSSRNDWCNEFPLGVDCLFVDTQAVCALPRSTRCDGGML